MASKLQLSSLCLLLLFSSFFVLLTRADDTSTAVHHAQEIPVDKIKNALSDSNYTTMSMTLELALSNLLATEFLNNKDIKTLTIFSPSDKPFMSPNTKYARPPLTFLIYHVAQAKLDREVLETSQLHWSKVETLLPGHVIVHGVEDSSDPAFQTIWFPQYDGEVLLDNDKWYTMEEAFDLFLEQKYGLAVILFIVLSAAGILVLFLCLLLRLCWPRHREDKDGYFPIESISVV